MQNKFVLQELFLLGSSKSECLSYPAIETGYTTKKVNQEIRNLKYTAAVYG